MRKIMRQEWIFLISVLSCMIIQPVIHTLFLKYVSLADQVGEQMVIVKFGLILQMIMLINIYILQEIECVNWLINLEILMIYLII